MTTAQPKKYAILETGQNNIWVVVEVRSETDSHVTCRLPDSLGAKEIRFCKRTNVIVARTNNLGDADAACRELQRTVSASFIAFMDIRDMCIRHAKRRLEGAS